MPYTICSHHLPPTISSELFTEGSNLRLTELPLKHLSELLLDLSSGGCDTYDSNLAPLSWGILIRALIGILGLVGVQDYLFLSLALSLSLAPLQTHICILKTEYGYIHTYIYIYIYLYICLYTYTKAHMYRCFTAS